MNKIKSILSRTAFIMPLLIVSSLSGCGYHWGSIAHPQIKSIAIAPVTNDTIEYNVSAEMRGMLAEQFNVDGSLRLVSLEEADCIIYCIIKKIETISIGEDSTDVEMTYRPAEWAIEIEGEFQVIIPGRATPLIPKRILKGYTTYQVTADNETGRRNGIKMACHDLAEKMVYNVTEAW
ncbi:MAG: hypothetical protein A2020_16355 [Lentisphaerae bacterium GWF2_45_14]|nr:MAG: hypothetical protein A2020_16355 [Lentisphaerae bacterium GWF2_45_14]